MTRGDGPAFWAVHTRRFSAPPKITLEYLVDVTFAGGELIKSSTPLLSVGGRLLAPDEPILSTTIREAGNAQGDMKLCRGTIHFDMSNNSE